jgi:NTE family protein
MTPTTRALVLSGGGGRGAYHVGVLEALVAHGWMEDGRGPDIIAGTSIGAINAAALASGLTVAQIKARWLAMHTEDVHHLSDDLPAVVRPLMRFLLHGVLTSRTHGGMRPPLPASNNHTSPATLAERLHMLFRFRPFSSLLNNRPWRRTLASWMDFERINSPAAPTLLLTATDLERGSLRVFCNRPRAGQPADTITIDHLMASASIPAIYPWTEIDSCKYWDGAVLANTPLNAVIQLAGSNDLDSVVVMMTPWYDEAQQAAEQCTRPPADLVQALSLTLDWSLLASYRTAIKMLSMYNDLVTAAEKLERAAEQTGDESLRMQLPELRRVALPTVIAPQTFMPLEWIVDYEDQNHHQLFAMGRADAERVLQARASA